MSFQGQVTFNNDVTLRDSISVPSVNSQSGVFTNSVKTSYLSGNEFKLFLNNSTMPYVSMMPNDPMNNQNPSVAFMVNGLANATYNTPGKIFNNLPVPPETQPKKPQPMNTAPVKATSTHTGKSTTPDVNK